MTSSMASARQHHANAGVAERAAAQPERMQAHAEMVLSMVESVPGLTGAEIGRRTGLGQHEAVRRLSDLANAGDVVKRDDLRRRCSVKGSTMAVWMTPDAERLL